MSSIFLNPLIPFVSDASQSSSGDRPRCRNIHLVRDYDREVRPINNDSNTVVINVGKSLAQLFDLVGYLIFQIAKKYQDFRLFQAFFVF